jgi:hypothetical protein
LFSSSDLSPRGFVWSIGVSLLLGCMELEVLQQVSTFVILLASSLPYYMNYTD